MPKLPQSTPAKALTLLLAEDQLTHLSSTQATVAGSAFCSDPGVFDPEGQFVLSDFQRMPKSSLRPVASPPSSLLPGSFLALIDLRPSLPPIELDSQFLGVTGSGAVCAQPPPVQSILKRLLSAVEPLFSFSDLRYLGYQINQPGLIATTVNQATSSFIGIHVDSWDHSAIPDRRHSRNRLCVNVGTEPRRLMFLPLTLTQVSDRMGDSFAFGPNWNPTGLVRTYLAANGSSPIIAIDIPPLHAYIAPTENIGHDATTRDTSTPDRALTLIGRFLPKPGCPLSLWRIAA